MSIDPMTGKPKPGAISQGLPTLGVAPDTEQVDDGGIRVSAWSGGDVMLRDDKDRGFLLDPFRAMDVGQRLIAMATFQLQQKMLALQEQAGVLQIVQNPPAKLHIVRDTGKSRP